MAEGAILVRQRCVGCLAYESVLKRVLTRAAVLPRENHFPLDESLERRFDVGPFHSSEQRGDALKAERFAENARRAQHAARIGAKLVEPGLHHTDDRFGQLRLPPRNTSEQLLEKERVSVGMRHDAL